jgi:hypothetical protein
MGVTSSSDNPLRLRQAEDGKWEVETAPGKWMKCETDGDARIISNAPVLEERASRATAPDQMLAAELEATADVLQRYNIGCDSRFFRSRAEDMRGNGSDAAVQRGKEKGTTSMESVQAVVGPLHDLHNGCCSP